MAEIREIEELLRTALPGSEVMVPKKECIDARGGEQPGRPQPAVRD